MGRFDGPAARLEEGRGARSPPATRSSSSSRSRNPRSATETGQDHGIRTVKPTSPARRYMTFLTNDEITKIDAGEEPALPSAAATGATCWAASRCGTGAAGTSACSGDVDFRREKFGIPAKVAAIEYDPNRSRPHRAAALPGRREAVHHRAARPQGRATRDVGAAGRHPAGQRAADPEHPARHARAQRRAAAGQGRAALPQRGHAGPARSPRKATTRNIKLPSGEVRQVKLDVHGHHRPGGQPRPRERLDRQGGARALEGLPPDGARHGR